MGHEGSGPGESVSSPDTRTGYIPGETFTAKEVQYAVIDGKAVFEGDIVLGTVEQVDRFSEEVRDQAVEPTGIGIAGRRFRWPYALVPFEIAFDLPNQDCVEDAIRHWEERTGVRFVLRTPENQAHYSDFVRFQAGTGCSADVGRRGGQQAVTLGDGCSTGNTIHEIGHAFGLWHEQSREDRDMFVTVNLQNVEPGQEHNFN